MFGINYYTRHPPNWNQIKTIHLACKLGFLEDVKKFLEENKDALLEKDIYQNTPLYYACLCGHTTVAKFLLELGARDEDKRCYTNALSSAVRELLKTYHTYTEAPSETKEITKEENELSLPQALLKLFQRAVTSAESTAILPLISSKDDMEQEKLFEEDAKHAFSDFKIIAFSNVVNTNSTLKTHEIGSSDGVSLSILTEEQLHDSINASEDYGQNAVFFCHQVILLSRCSALRKLLLKGSVLDTSSGGELTTEMECEVVKTVRENYNHYFAKPRVLVVSGANVAAVRLAIQFLYANECNATSIENELRVETDTAGFESLLKLSSLFELEDFTRALTEMAKKKKLKIDLAKYKPVEPKKQVAGSQPPNQKKQNMASKFLNAFDHCFVFGYDGFEETDKKKKKGNTDSLSLEEEVDKLVLQTAMQECSDVIIKTVPAEVQTEAQAPHTTATSTTTEMEQTPVTPYGMQDRRYFYGHKVMLMARSYYFKVLFAGSFEDSAAYYNSSSSSSKPVFQFEECSFATLKAVLKYFYTDRPQVNNTTAVELLFLASRYGLSKNLVKQVETFIMNQVTAENAVELWMIAEAVALEELSERILHCILQFLKQDFSNYQKFTKALQDLEAPTELMAKLEATANTANSQMARKLRQQATPKKQPQCKQQ